MQRGQGAPVILYGRVSQISSSDSRSVDDQLAELRRWAAREGWHIVGEYRDDGISASRYANGKARAGWEAVVSAIQTGAIRGGALLVWEFSRATRDQEVAARLQVECERNGAKIGYHGTLRDPSTADGGFGLGLDALLAARESAIISERVKRAVDSRAARGRPHGTIPYGYRQVIDPETGKPRREKDPKQAPVVEEIVRRMLNRESMDSIAADLNRRGIRTATGKEWRAPNLAKLARRPTYAGLRVYHGKVRDDVRGDWPAIISEADYYTLVDMHLDPARDKYRNPTHVKHLGTGIYRCGREGCDGVMRVLSPPNRAPYYSCRACHGISRLLGPVDEFIETVMWQRLGRGDILDLLAENDADEERKAAAEEAIRLRGKLAEIRRRVQAEELDIEDLAHFRSRWEPRIRAAEERARPKSVPPLLFEVAGPEAEQKWKALRVVEKRALLDALLDVTILPVGRGRKSFDPRDVRLVWKGQPAESASLANRA